MPIAEELGVTTIRASRVSLTLPAILLATLAACAPAGAPHGDPSSDEGRAGRVLGADRPGQPRSAARRRRPLAGTRSRTRCTRWSSGTSAATARPSTSRDPKGRRWSVKIGPEAQSEVAASRIVWAVGYPQLPSYYLPRWRWRWPDREQQGSEGPARFRPRVDRFDTDGTWSWHQNPFVGSQPVPRAARAHDGAEQHRFEGRQQRDRGATVRPAGATVATS